MINLKNLNRKSVRFSSRRPAHSSTPVFNFSDSPTLREVIEIQFLHLRKGGWAGGGGAGSNIRYIKHLNIKNLDSMYDLLCLSC